MSLSEKSYKEFKRISEENGITYESDFEMKQSADNLVRFVKLMVELDQEHKGWDRRLEQEPQGFALASNGRSCSLCGQSVYGEVWYDKWGMKCFNCHEAFKKRIIPGYVFKDRKNDKHITDSRLSHISGLYIQTIHKLVRQGKIKARKVPHGPMVFLRKENPELGKIIEVEKERLTANKLVKQR